MKTRITRTIVAAAALCGVVGAAWVVAPVDAANDPTAQARALLIDTTGTERGIIRFAEYNGTVVVDAQATNLAPGFHGFHVHSTGTCRNPDGTTNFALAGGHYGHDLPGGITHGNHPGDLPSLYVDASGNASARLNADRFAVADLAGRAVIVHAGPDNFANIPARYTAAIDDTTLATGDAGARSLCGAIQIKP
jgi:Cu-Zn family superoxide dismutase